MRAKLFVALLVFLPQFVNAEEPSLAAFLAKAWAGGPPQRAERSKLEESEQFISSARGKYFPHLSLAAIDTTGFPASNSQLQVGGLMGSPFRSGLAGGAILEQTIYDFGRINAVLEEAKAEKSLAEGRLAEDKFRFLFSLGDLYLACARARSLMAQNERMMIWAKLIFKESARFTKTGQRSIVDNALVLSQVNDLNLQQEELKKLQTSLIEQMKPYAGEAGCRTLAESWKERFNEELRVEEPTLVLAKAAIEVSQARLEGAKAAQLPTLKVMGSLGEMDKSRLVTKEDYSAGVGLVFPLWNGGEDWHREEAFKSQVQFQTESFKAAELDFTTRMRDLKDSYQRGKETLATIDVNLEQVRGTMKLASDRYRRLEGPLIDVREAYKELQKIEVERVSLLHTLAETSFQLNLLKTR